ncbi:MAG: prepilin peptidase [Thermoguttaceae bacterium]
MTDILAYPVEVRLLLIFGIGCLLAYLIRRIVFYYAPDSNWTPKSFQNRLMFWGVPTCLTALFYWEVVLWSGSLAGKISQLQLNMESAETLHWRFLAHAALFLLLWTASFIDFKTLFIPDSITISGMILGLSLAVLIPQSLLPATALVPVPARKNVSSEQMHVEPLAYSSTPIPLHIASSQPFPEQHKPQQSKLTLLLAISICWFTCFALMNRIWYHNAPFGIALALFWRNLIRFRSTLYLLVLAGCGTLFIILRWSQSVENPASWIAFFSALIGLFAGMTLIWSVRLIGSWALDREAMGFGDVTLLGMIGAFLGWQSCVLIFFLAPLAGLFFALARLLLRGEREIPYGPFLCLGTAFVVVFWPQCWNYSEPYFSLGWIVPSILLFCMVALGIILAIWQRIRLSF